MTATMKPNWIPVFVLVLLLSACGTANTPPTGEPTVAPTATPGTGFRTEIPVINTRTDRRAPTLGPTDVPTELPTATDAPTQLPTASDLPAATATLAVTSTPLPSPSPTLPAATDAPKLAPAVYVTAFQVDPSTPKSNAEFVFHLAFLNTVGTAVNYPHWRVLILPQGQTKAVGDPAGVSKTIVAGTSRQDTETWKIKLKGPCESYVGQPIWEMEDGAQIPFLQPNGKNITIQFQVCP